MTTMLEKRKDWDEAVRQVLGAVRGEPVERAARRVMASGATGRPRAVAFAVLKDTDNPWRAMEAAARIAKAWSN